MADSPVAGWYDDPADETMLRYWDGAAWTGRVRPKNAPPAAPPMGAASAGGFSGGYATTAAPPNYLAQAILTTLFCCLPFGIVAIVKSTQVNSLWQAGQHDAAVQASADTKRWAWIAFGIGVGVQVITIGFYIVAIAASSSSGY